MKISLRVSFFNLFVLLSLLSFSLPAFAKGDISSVAEHLTKQMDAISILLVVIAYVAGVGFSLLGITQFKANKDNPQQTPISKPITYVIIASALLFLPTLMKTAGESVFGGTSGKKQVASSDFRAIDLD